MVPSDKRRPSDLLQVAWQVGILTMVPFILVGGPLIGYGIGEWVDRRFYTDPYGKVVLILFGVVASFREIFLIVRNIIRKNP